MKMKEERKNEKEAVKAVAEGTEPKTAKEPEGALKTLDETDAKTVRKPKEAAETGKEGHEEAPAMVESSVLAAAVAEAEMRGYMRGRNESIENLMKAPEGVAEKMEEAAAEPVEILSRSRVSIWDL